MVCKALARSDVVLRLMERPNVEKRDMVRTLSREPYDLNWHERHVEIQRERPRAFVVTWFGDIEKQRE